QSYIAFWLALQFGLRFSEILGLQWKNIDFKNKILHVEQAYHEPEKELGRLKTNASRRSISMSDQKMEYLKEYKEKQTQKRKIDRSTKNKSLSTFHFNVRPTSGIFKGIQREANTKK